LVLVLLLVLLLGLLLGLLLVLLLVLLLGFRLRAKSQEPKADLFRPKAKGQWLVLS
jgi:hypothetical protein